MSPSSLAVVIAGAVATLAASAGDLFVTGSLRSADLGASRQGLVLSAPAGTVYVTGTVDTSGADGAGQAGGPITINALRVVITGRLLSAGGDSEQTGGAGGAITINAGQTQPLTVTVRRPTAAPLIRPAAPPTWPHRRPTWPRPSPPPGWS